MHNTPQQNADFRAAFDATNARWKAQQTKPEADTMTSTSTKPKRTKKPQSAIIYSGPSLIDGSPIVCVAIVSSSNSKTGDVLQTHIIRADISPLEASKTGADHAICGDCKHRGTATNDSTKKQATGRTCYVNIGQGPTQVYKRLRGANTYPTATPEQTQELGRDRMVRLGAYCDPSAVPAHIWDNLLSHSTAHTGYTHQHSTNTTSDYRRNMYSADTAGEARQAHALGYRTFRVIPVASYALQGKNALLENEILCPASKEAGQRVTCDQCKLCSGSSIQAKSVAIVAHGPGRANVTDVISTAKAGV